MSVIALKESQAPLVGELLTFLKVKLKFFFCCSLLYAIAGSFPPQSNFLSINAIFDLLGNEGFLMWVDNIPFCDYVFSAELNVVCYCICSRVSPDCEICLSGSADSSLSASACRLSSDVLRQARRGRGDIQTP